MSQVADHPEELDIHELLARNLDSVDGLRQDYEARRRYLLQRESEEDWERRARASASELEKRAQEITWKVREHEREHLFGNVASEKIPGPETLDMGGQFLTNKNRIEGQSLLFKIARRMPKGCHLHLHFNAELAPSEPLREAEEQPNIFIRSTRPILHDQDYIETEIVFEVKAEDTPTVDIWSPDYDPTFKGDNARPWMRWRDFQREFQRRRSGQDAVDWVRGKMVLSEDEAYDKTQTTNGVWARFNQATRAFKGLINYEHAFTWYVESAIDSMIDDGIMYAELRPMLLDKGIPTNDGMGFLDHRWQMRTILEQTQLKKDKLQKAGLLHKFPFGLKIIYSAPRSIPKQMMEREMRDCIQLKLEFPELICGFDLVGAEDRANNIGFYSDQLLAMVKTCHDLSIDIPFMFHAGESLLDLGGSRDPAKSNLYDALLFNARRIGHGYALLKHPLLVDEFKRRSICIELCPTSNELLHLCRNVKEHPFPQMLAAGLHCTLNSDNPSLFANSVSHEFYQVMVGSPSMTIHGWKQLAQWSIEHSCLDEADKLTARNIFDGEWEAFCQWIVDSYADVAAAIDLQMPSCLRA